LQSHEEAQTKPTELLSLQLKMDTIS
jgi:hypothetical protein